MLSKSANDRFRVPQLLSQSLYGLVLIAFPLHLCQSLSIFQKAVFVGHITCNVLNSNKHFVVQEGMLFHLLDVHALVGVQLQQTRYEAFGL